MPVTAPVRLVMQSAGVFAAGVAVSPAARLDLLVSRAFCKTLEAGGVTFDRSCQELEQLGIAIAFFTDPWGTCVELTEGLDEY